MKNKWLSILVLTVFLYQEIGWAITPHLKNINQSFESASQFSIPASIGFVEESHLSKENSSQKTIYLIHDAHTNESAQMNISKIIDFIMKKEINNRYVFLEAGSGDESLVFLKEMTSKDLMRDVSLKYLRKGLLQGPEYLNLNSNYNFSLWGAEDNLLYDKSLLMYQDTVSSRKQVLNYIGRIKSSAQFLKNHIYNQTLLHFDSIYTSYKNEDISISDYLDQVFTLIEEWNIPTDDLAHLDLYRKIKSLEASIDFKKVNSELKRIMVMVPPEVKNKIMKQNMGTELIRRGQEKSELFLLKSYLENDSYKKFNELKKYLIYLEEFSKLKTDAFINELNSVELKIFSVITETENERRLFESSEALIGLEDLVRLRLDSNRYEKYLSDGYGFKLKNIIGVINQLIMSNELNQEKVVFYKNGIQESIDTAKEFYNLTFLRDKAILKNMISKMDEEKINESFLVVGGYHSKSFKELFKKNKINFISIIPHISHETNHMRYERLLLAQDISDQFMERKTNQNALNTRRMYESSKLGQHEYWGQFLMDAKITGAAAARLAKKKTPKGFKIDTVKSAQREFESADELASFLEKEYGIDRTEISDVDTKGYRFRVEVSSRSKGSRNRYLTVVRIPNQETATHRPKHEGLLNVYQFRETAKKGVSSLYLRSINLGGNDRSVIVEARDGSEPRYKIILSDRLDYPPVLVRMHQRTISTYHLGSGEQLPSVHVLPNEVSDDEFVKSDFWKRVDARIYREVDDELHIHITIEDSEKGASPGDVVYSKQVSLGRSTLMSIRQIEYAEEMLTQAYRSFLKVVDKHPDQFKDLNERYPWIWDVAKNADEITVGSLRESSYVPRFDLRAQIVQHRNGTLMFYGIPGSHRDAIVENLRARFNFHGLDIRPIGDNAIQVVRLGVGKELAIHWLNRSKISVLKDMGYQPDESKPINALNRNGSFLVVSSTTLFLSTSSVGKSNFYSSPVHSDVIEYLEAGGALAITTYEDSSEIRDAIVAGDGLPVHLRDRVILIADGGAVAYRIGFNDQLIEIEDYRLNSLNRHDSFSSPIQKSDDILVLLNSDEYDLQNLQRSIGSDRSIVVSSRSSFGVGKVLLVGDPRVSNTLRILSQINVSAKVGEDEGKKVFRSRLVKEIKDDQRQILGPVENSPPLSTLVSETGTTVVGNAAYLNSQITALVQNPNIAIVATSSNDQHAIELMANWRAQQFVDQEDASNVFLLVPSELSRSDIFIDDHGVLRTTVVHLLNLSGAVRRVYIGPQGIPIHYVQGHIPDVELDKSHLTLANADKESYLISEDRLGQYTHADKHAINVPEVVGVFNAPTSKKGVKTKEKFNESLSDEVSSFIDAIESDLESKGWPRVYVHPPRTTHLKYTATIDTSEPGWRAQLQDVIFETTRSDKRRGVSQMIVEVREDEPSILFEGNTVNKVEVETVVTRDEDGKFEVEIPFVDLVIESDGDVTGLDGRVQATVEVERRSVSFAEFHSAAVESGFLSTESTKWFEEKITNQAQKIAAGEELSGRRADSYTTTFSLSGSFEIGSTTSLFLPRLVFVDSHAGLPSSPSWTNHLRDTRGVKTKSFDIAKRRASGRHVLLGKLRDLGEKITPLPGIGDADISVVGGRDAEKTRRYMDYEDQEIEDQRADFRSSQTRIVKATKDEQVTTEKRLNDIRGGTNIVIFSSESETLERSHIAKNWSYLEQQKRDKRGGQVNVLYASVDPGNVVIAEDGRLFVRRAAFLDGPNQLVEYEFAEEDSTDLAEFVEVHYAYGTNVFGRNSTTGFGLMNLTEEKVPLNSTRKFNSGAENNKILQVELARSLGIPTKNILTTYHFNDWNDAMVDQDIDFKAIRDGREIRGISTKPGGIPKIFIQPNNSTRKQYSAGFDISSDAGMGRAVRFVDEVMRVPRNQKATFLVQEYISSVPLRGKYAGEGRSFVNDVRAIVTKKPNGTIVVRPMRIYIAEEKRATIDFERAGEAEGITLEDVQSMPIGRFLKDYADIPGETKVKLVEKIEKYATEMFAAVDEQHDGRIDMLAVDFIISDEFDEDGIPVPRFIETAAQFAGSIEWDELIYDTSGQELLLFLGSWRAELFDSARERALRYKTEIEDQPIPPIAAARLSKNQNKISLLDIDTEEVRRFEKFGARLVDDEVQRKRLEAGELIPIDFLKNLEPFTIRFEYDESSNILRSYYLNQNGEYEIFHEIQNLDLVRLNNSESTTPVINASDLLAIIQEANQAIENQIDQISEFKTNFRSSLKVITFDLDSIQTSDKVKNHLLKWLLSEFERIYEESDGTTRFRVIGDQGVVNRFWRYAESEGVSNIVVFKDDESLPESHKGSDVDRIQILESSKERQEKIRQLPLKVLTEIEDSSDLPSFRGILRLAIFGSEIDYSSSEFEYFRLAYQSLLGKKITHETLVSILEGTASPQVVEEFAIPALTRVPINQIIRFLRTAIRMAGQSA